MTAVLAGRAAIVTGGSHGLGLEIARTYIAAGARVLVCARDADALAGARSELESLARDRTSVATITADVAQPDAVEGLVDHAIERFSQVHVLVNNAGIYGPKGLTEDVSWDEWEHAVRVNLFGSVLCSRAVLPHFRENGYGKIIQLSGGGATSPLPRLSAYAASKAAVVRFAETLAEELRGTGIDVNAVAPGALNTRLLDEVLEAGPERVGTSFYERAVEQRASGGTPLDEAARLAVFLGSGASDGITGKLISAPWDPWEELPSHTADLESTDVYTLRRIVPTDRGLSWS
jgi:NAD(P)-dependent dehydrogenase (short-subunit alcohol dehydrogenase family)